MMRRTRGTEGRGRWSVRVAVMLVAAAVAAGVDSRAAAAQERDSIPGVTLGLVYETSYRPALALKPFTGRFGGGGLAPRVEAIIGRDLRNADRFEVLDSLPAHLVGEAVDYALWDRLGAVWLLTGQVEGAGSDYVLLLELHDVVYGQVKEKGRFRIPDPADEDFRMAVHRASDAIVRWATGDPGMAASRIAFSMVTGEGAKELYVIDADGENLRRLTRDRSIILSPAWSTDGTRIAFSRMTDDAQWRIFELDLATGEERPLPVLREGSYITPAYHPDGKRLAFAILGGGRSGVYTYDVADGCCLANVTGGRWNDQSPTFSPDGQRMAFNSNRFGIAVPQIMVMPTAGGEAETLSPFRSGSGGFYTAPDWSPRGDFVAFHGRIRRGEYQILVADPKDLGHRVRQLTWEGNNEDPTWAPDGRHLAFVGERRWGFGLMVVDVSSGKIRTLVSSRRVSVPDWSPTLTPGG